MKLTHLTRAVFALGIVLAAVSCSDSSTEADNANPDVSDPNRDSIRPEDPLFGTVWRVKAVDEGNTSHRPPAYNPPSPEASLEFCSPGRVHTFYDGNSGAGRYSADDDDNFGAWVDDMTEMGSPGSEFWLLLSDALNDATSWSIDDDGLVLTGPTLTIRAAESHHDG